MLVCALAAVAIPAAPRPAEACSCYHSNVQCGAAGDFWKTQAVFVGRVLSIENLAPRSLPRFFGRRKVRVRVVEGFRGTAAGQPDVSVLTGSGGGDCGYPFRVGEEYLVYASRNEESGELTTGICSRTRKAEDASTDIEYSRLAAVGRAPAGRVLGEVWLRQSDIGGLAPSPDRPMRGVHVQLQKAASVMTAVSDEHGGFIVEGPEPGIYDVSAEAPEGYVAVAMTRRIEVTDSQSCVAVDITVNYDGRVRGRVVDAHGRGIAAVDVQAVGSVNRDKVLSSIISATTSDDGTYELKGVPPGRFVVGINLKRQSEADVDEPRIFHPGVASSLTAQVVRLRPSERVSAGDLVLPESMAFAPIRGVVVDTAGVPVAGAAVYLKRDGVGGHIVAVRDTNQLGEFVIAALASRRYQVFAEYAGRDLPAKMMQSSEAIAIDAAAGMTPLRLVVRRQY